MLNKTGLMRSKASLVPFTFIQTFPWFKRLDTSDHWEASKHRFCFQKEYPWQSYKQRLFTHSSGTKMVNHWSYLPNHGIIPSKKMLASVYWRSEGRSKVKSVSTAENLVQKATWRRVNVNRWNINWIKVRYYAKCGWQAKERLRNNSQPSLQFLFLFIGSMCLSYIIACKIKIFLMSII